MIIDGVERFGPPWVWSTAPPLPLVWRKEAVRFAKAVADCSAQRELGSFGHGPRRSACRRRIALMFLLHKRAELGLLQDASHACPIERELAGYVLALPFAWLKQLAAMGVPPQFLARMSLGDLGRAMVTLGRRGDWEPGGSDPRLILAVRDQRGVLIDMLALSARNRDEWSLRIGGNEAVDGWALGMDRFHAVADREDRSRPAVLRLFATPLDWLIGAGDGICVTEWTPGALRHLRMLDEGVALQVDPAAKDNLRAMLAHGGLPRVEAIRNGMRRAA